MVNIFPSENFVANMELNGIFCRFRCPVALGLGLTEMFWTSKVVVDFLFFLESQDRQMEIELASASKRSDVM